LDLSALVNRYFAADVSSSWMGNSLNIIFYAPPLLGRLRNGSKAEKREKGNSSDLFHTLLVFLISLRLTLWHYYCRFKKIIFQKNKKCG
jgi:hypothetical protein